MKTVFISIIFLSMATLHSDAQDTVSRKKNFNLEKNIAIQGYDPVAYFKQGKAIEGNSAISVTYQGIVYRFSATGNKDEFFKNPSMYEPQYGGWCAYAMGKSGDRVEIDPGTFKIINNRLYLFYNKYFNNTLKSWNKDEAHLKANADANWQKINQ